MPKAKTMTYERFELRVVGKTWQGFKAIQLYNLAGKSHPKTLTEAKALAGDFDAVTAASIIKTVTTVKTQTIAKLA